MKKFLKLLPPILFLLAAAAIGFMALSLPGCASQATPAQELQTAQVSLDTVVAGLNAAHAAGKLSANQEAQILPYVNAAEAAIESLQTAVAANDQSGIDAALNAFGAAMNSLAQSQAKLQPATKPTG